MDKIRYIREDRPDGRLALKVISDISDIGEMEVFYADNGIDLMTRCEAARKYGIGQVNLADISHEFKGYDW